MYKVAGDEKNSRVYKIAHTSPNRFFQAQYIFSNASTRK